jgi:hypothetical protein
LRVGGSEGRDWILVLSEGNVKFEYVGDGEGEGTACEKRKEGKCIEGILFGVVEVGMNEEAAALSTLGGEKSRKLGDDCLMVTFAYDLGFGVDGTGSESTECSECSESVRSKNSDDVGDPRSKNNISHDVDIV